MTPATRHIVPGIMGTAIENLTKAVSYDEANSEGALCAGKFLSRQRQQAPGEGNLPEGN